MKTLFKNNYQEILLHPELGIFEQRFLPASQDLFGDDYIREVSIFGETIQKNQSDENPYPNLIVNTLNGGPTMEPKVQEFMHAEFYPMIFDAGIRTKAYCLGDEILSKLSVELTAENDPNSKFKYKFFANLEEGMDWLRNQ
ncbi:MAG: hypothetical protein ABJG78_18655 [Cyclobacteriaceae bacterium]